MSKNFYDYMYGGEKTAVAQDADNAYDPQNPTPGKYGLSHEDGSPCDAKTPETCPHNKKAKLVEQKKQDADMLNKEDGKGGESDHPNGNLDRHLKELKSILEDPEVQKAIPAIKGMTFEGLAAAYDAVGREYEELEMNIGNDYMKGTRAAAEKVAADNPGKDYHTFTMDGRDRNDELESMDAWGVTFHTTRMSKPDDPGYVDDDEYDRRVAMLDKVSGSDGPNVGIFQGKPEISVACPDMKKALVQMVKFEQNSIYNYKTGKTIYNLTYSEEANPGLERGTTHIG